MGGESYDGVPKWHDRAVLEARSAAEKGAPGGSSEREARVGSTCPAVVR